ncbi:MAG: metallopeptidase TldD-related protein [Bryobacteraceae bacterium]|nr:metallopeptidase TldD-related protein [Bryobacteraceae bacterium]MDW8380150.1 metallopeptidase TldD-related protein [Bryobacterales bacterium]
MVAPGAALLAKGMSLNPELLETAKRVVSMALAKGATGAECTILEGSEFSVNVRRREVETLKDAGSKGAGVRVLVGKRVGSSYTSDLSQEGLVRMVSSAVELARITTEDPYAGLPEEEELGSVAGDLQLFSDDIDAVDTSGRIALAQAAEEAAFRWDPRIVNSEGASFGAYRGCRYFANSRGFAGCYRASSCSISAVPVAKDGDSMERDYWYHISRSFAGLEAPERVGMLAAQRALRRLHPRKAPTQKAPVVFERRVAASLLGDLFEAVAGDSVYRQASFLAGKLDQKVGSSFLTVIDDATIPGLFGSQPFDDEGVPSRRTTVLEKGVLRSYLLNTYTARKLGLKTTGNASRGVTGNASVGHGNFFLEPGPDSPESIIRSVKNGFFVTELIGSGVNIVTGDYSLGATGLWIEGGELAYPVSEVTIAANLKDMLHRVEAVGSDLEFRGSIASPTVLIGEMTISGS